MFWREITNLRDFIIPASDLVQAYVFCIHKQPHAHYHMTLEDKITAVICDAIKQNESEHE